MGPLSIDNCVALSGIAVRFKMNKEAVLLCFRKQIFLCLTVIFGCGGKPADQPPTAEVVGIVLLDGKPLEYATLKFQPDSGRFSLGMTDKEGHYRMTYNKRTMGAKVDHHVVSITTLRYNTDMSDPTSPPFPEILPSRYHTKTELTADVKPGHNEINFDLQSK